MNWLSCVGAIMLAVIVEIQGIMWHQEPNTVRCLKEEVQGNVLVVGDYEVSEAPGQRVDYIIKDSKNHVLSQKEDIPHGKSWKFSFVTETYDTFETCFKSQVPNHIRGTKQVISLKIRQGIEAKSYEGISEAAKLKPIEVELKRLEDLSEEIVQGFTRMREHEEQMRDTNEQTNARVFYFSIFSMCCLLGLAAWQLFYLRRYFRAKKLIE